MNEIAIGVASTVIAAILIKIANMLFLKYEAAKDWNKIIVLYIVDMVLSVAAICVATEVLTNPINKVLLILFAFVGFASASVMFVAVTHVLSGLQEVMNRIGYGESQTSGKK